MLERLPRTRAILLDDKNLNQRQMLNVAIAAQRPIVERIRDETKDDGAVHFGLVFAAYERELVLPPGFPSNGVLAFAREVTEAWKDSRNDERVKAGFPKAFTTKVTTAFSFFGAAMKETVLLAGRLAARMRRLEVLDKMLKGEIGLDTGQDQLRQRDENFREARFERISAVYVSGDVSERIPDLPHELEATEARLFGRMRHIGRKLSVGYNPII